jgi:hypothetical protein
MVVENVDELGLGRVLVRVPGVLGVDHTAWAMPCVPYAGPGVGLYLPPPAGANVWVEFEGGDPGKPILAGCFWGEGHIPLDVGPPGEPTTPLTKLLKTEAFKLVMSEEPEKGVQIVVGPPVSEEPVTIVVNPDGLRIAMGASSLAITPEGIQVLTPETLTLTVDEAAISVTAEEIAIACAEASVLLGPEGVVVNEGALEVI